MSQAVLVRSKYDYGMQYIAKPMKFDYLAPGVLFDDKLDF